MGREEITIQKHYDSFSADKNSSISIICLFL
jgi:hypothetical protein